MTKNFRQNSRAQVPTELNDDELAKVVGGDKSITSPVVVSEIVITKRLDKASTKLFLN
jgi:bacteriocin-like protein